MPFRVANKKCHLAVHKTSKLSKFELIKTTTTITNIARTFFNMWVRHNGMLNIIICDHGGKVALDLRFFL
jgi:hypothetical protein